MEKIENHASADIRPGDELQRFDLSTPIPGAEALNAGPQIREEFCSRCRRIRNQITAVFFYVFFPLTFPLATFLFFYIDHFVKTPPRTPFIHIEMSEEEYRRERAKRHALLEEMDRELRQRNLRRLHWMTLGLVPKRILACLA